MLSNHLIIIFLSTLIYIGAVMAYPSTHPQRNRCGKECQMHRPNGSTDAFSINCAKTHCDYACPECPETLGLEYCDNSDWSLRTIYCRSIPSHETRCMQRCDHHRLEGYLGNFSFSCDDKNYLPTPWEKRMCEDDCSDCTLEICDSSHYFHCPPEEKMPERPPPYPQEPEYENSKCEQRCDKDRKKRRDDDIGSREDDSYYLYCSLNYRENNAERQKCEEDCSSCPLNVCDAILDPGDFKCPLSRSKPPPPTKRSKYILSWTIIALIGAAVVICIGAATFYGRIRVRGGDGGGARGRCCFKRRRITPEQQPQLQEIMDTEEGPESGSEYVKNKTKDKTLIKSEMSSNTSDRSSATDASSVISVHSETG